MAGHQFTPGLRNTSMMVGMSTLDYDVVVVGAGNGGLSAAALLKRRGCQDVALVEPSPVHVYKPLQNYVGVGLGEISSWSGSRPTSSRPGCAGTRRARRESTRRTIRCIVPTGRR